jgi:hypothetical protein
MPTDDPYKLWDVIGTWAAALGTFAAVIASLWLARRSEAPRLKITAEIWGVLNQSMISTDDDSSILDIPSQILLIQVTNLAPLPVKINGIGWQSLRLPSPGLLQNPPTDTCRSHGPPAMLGHGDQLQWKLDYKPILAEHFFWLRKMDDLRVVAWTSTGQKFAGRVGRRMEVELARKTGEFRYIAEAEVLARPFTWRAVPVRLIYKFQHWRRFH